MLRACVVAAVMCGTQAGAQEYSPDKRYEIAQSLMAEYDCTALPADDDPLGCEAVRGRMSEVVACTFLKDDRLRGMCFDATAKWLVPE